MSARLTRRALVAAAPPALLAATARPALAEPQVSGDAAVLTRVMRAELVAEAAYEGAAAFGDARVAALAAPFAVHEARHVQALRTDLEALGAVKPQPPADGAALDAAAADLGLPPFGELRAPRAVLRWLLELEERLVGAWVRAHRDLQDADLTQSATSMLACQAQHLVVLREALGAEMLPSAFERGRQ